MRIALLAPISWRVPPLAYGPWERFVGLLADGLVAAGVDVTVFATADSVTSARLVPTAQRGYSQDPTLDAKVEECLHVATAMERASEFDIIHNSADFLPLTYSGLVDTPMLTTIHGFSSERIVPVYGRYDATTWYVAISDADRHPHLHYAATVRHGIDVDDLTWQDDHGDRLLFFGRIHPDKGTVEAIDVALAAGMPLDIAGIVADAEYFDAHVAPRIDGSQVRYLGTVDARDRATVLSGARALLHMIDFDEPFGLSVAEALACGTPVIARRRGAMSELIDDGVTGVLVDDVPGAVAAVQTVTRLDRTAIRRDAERRFARSTMVAGYLRVYRGILDGTITPLDG